MITSSYVFSFISIIPVRSDHQDEAEIVTQLLFGETAKVIDQHKQWLKISCTHDNYEGWIDHKQVLPINESEFFRLNTTTTRVTDTIAMVKGPWGDIIVTKGAKTPVSSGFFSIGEHSFELKNPILKESVNLTSLALSYLNTPYLWGGRSPFGIDCSGFTQLVLSFKEISVPRDASLQEKEGNFISFSERKPGDIVFFVNDNGKIHHVGMLLENDEIIHAHGRVRIDKLTEEGILNKELEITTHKLASIKRFFNKF
jgi:cell wall-associated NlpC family hydrolase